MAGETRSAGIHPPGAIAALASAYAADHLRCHAIAKMIRAGVLGPEAIFRLFGLSAAADSGRACAVVLIAGATARFNACREGWNGDAERELAMEALDLDGGDIDREFVRVSSEAAAI